jgi:hypothetical protein
MDSKGRIVQSWQKDKEGEASHRLPPGEVGFCFSNGMSSFASKTIEFEVLVAPVANSEAANAGKRKSKNLGAAGTPQELKENEAIKPLQQSLTHLKEELDSMSRTLRYIKARENRNLQTVLGTELRIFYFSIFDVLLIIGMAVLQVYILRTFFTVKGKIRV